MNLYIKSILIILLITLLGVGGGLIWEKVSTPTEAKAKHSITIDDLLQQSIDTDTITTNFTDGGFIKARFKLIATSQKKAEDLQKLSFEVQSTIIQTLNGMKSEDVNGPKGLDFVENLLKKRLNQELGENYIERVYTTEKTVQTPS